MSDSDSDHEVNNLLPKLKKTNNLTEEYVDMNNHMDNNKLWKENEKEEKLIEMQEIISIENISDFKHVVLENLSKIKNLLMKSISNLIFFKALSNFKEIAQGGFSKIFKGFYKSTIIVKKYFKSFSFSSFLNELRLLKKLRHPNIPIFYGCFIENFDEILLNLRNNILKSIYLIVKNNLSVENKDNSNELAKCLDRYSQNININQLLKFSYFLNTIQKYVDTGSVEDSNLNNYIGNYFTEIIFDILNCSMILKEETKLNILFSKEASLSSFMMEKLKKLNITIPDEKISQSIKKINEFVDNKNLFFFDISELRFSLIIEFLNSEKINKFYSSNEQIKLLIFIKICNCLDMLHNSFHLIHRDLNPNNVIVDDFLNVKIIDFGISKMTDRTKTTTLVKGTLNYMCPEEFDTYNKKAQITNKVDIWGLGCIINEVFSNENVKPWNNETNDSKLMGLLIGKKKFPVNNDILNREIKEVITKCCELNPNYRLNISELSYLLTRILINNILKFMNENNNTACEEMNNRLKSFLINQSNNFLVQTQNHYIPDFLRPNYNINQKNNLKNREEFNILLKFRDSLFSHKNKMCFLLSSNLEKFKEFEKLYQNINVNKIYKIRKVETDKKSFEKFQIKEMKFNETNAEDDKGITLPSNLTENSINKDNISSNKNKLKLFSNLNVKGSEKKIKNNGKIEIPTPININKNMKIRLVDNSKKDTKINFGFDFNKKPKTIVNKLNVVNLDVPSNRMNKSLPNNIGTKPRDIKLIEEFKAKMKIENSSKINLPKIAGKTMVNFNNKSINSNSNVVSNLKFNNLSISDNIINKNKKDNIPLKEKTLSDKDKDNLKETVKYDNGNILNIGFSDKLKEDKNTNLAINTNGGKFKITKNNISNTTNISRKVINLKTNNNQMVILKKK